MAGQGPGPDTAAIIGGILEITVALAGIGTAVTLFPILKKRNESFALGLVAARVLESATIFVGVAFLLSIVTLRQNGAGAGALVTSHALVDLYDRIFLLGQSFMPAVCDLLLGFLLYKSRLVPRGLSLIGSLEDPCSSSAISPCCLALSTNNGPVAALSALLVAVFEFSLGVWLIVKGFTLRLLPHLSPRTSRPNWTSRRGLSSNGTASGGSGRMTAELSPLAVRMRVGAAGVAIL